MMPRLLLADDHTVVGEGLARILESEFDLVARVTDGQTAVAETRRLRPDVVVMDISMPLLNGIEAMRQILERQSVVKVVILTQRADRQYVRAAFEAGAAAYVVKQSAAAELIRAIREALAGHYYISPSLTDDAIKSRFNPKINPSQLFGSMLTPRQRQVLQLVAEGRSAKDIAGVLNISTKTAEFHKAALMQQLGIHSTAELTRYAIEHGIIESSFAPPQ
jgi:DNA-binding NarL/FixJ family response regulator